MLTFNLILIVILIMATAFFVASEFAIVKLRPSRVDQLVLEGNKNALAVQTVTSNLDGYLSACQLGITITALGLGWLGKPTVETLLYPLLEPLFPAGVVSLISFVIAFSFITFLHVVVGELAPKTIAIQKAEAVTTSLAKPLIWFYRIMYPFIWILNGSGNTLVKWLGFKPAKEHEEAHSQEELRIILTESYNSGKINKSEYGYVNKIFKFDDLLAREIMVPRTDMVCLYVEKTLAENLKIMKDEQYTRYPVVRGNKDNVIGVVNSKQFFLKYCDQAEVDLTSIIRPAFSVSETTPINVLLKRMQQSRAHLVILIDEYGGTSGMLTIEDILEEIVGDIRDEFDEDEAKDVEVIDENRYLVDGKVSIAHINELLKCSIDSEDMDTLGGWLYCQNSELKKGEVWQCDDICFKIMERDKHRIRKVEISKPTL